MDIEALVYFLHTSKTCTEYIEGLKICGFEIDPSVIEAINNIKKQIDIEAINIIDASSDERSKKASNAMIIIKRMMANMLRLFAQKETEHSDEANSMAAKYELEASLIEKKMQKDN